MRISGRNKCRDCEDTCDICAAITSLNGSCTDTENTRVLFRKHETICRQGTEVTHAMYLISGLAKMYIEGDHQRNIILSIIKPHNYIGLLSFFEPVDYCYSVMALEDSQVCMIDLQLVKELYKNNNDFFSRLNQAFARSSAAVMKKIITLNQKHVRGRVAENLLYLSDLYGTSPFNMRLTRKELGELCAISEENTVRVLTEFRTENIIEIQGRSIKILDVKLLQKISDIG